MRTMITIKIIILFFIKCFPKVTGCCSVSGYVFPGLPIATNAEDGLHQEITLYCVRLYV